uniref:Uncharacterized protein n=1 Tax=Onchocerca volvulus TaxID=6282 RepID=A0A8R1TLL7_ONCVO
MLLSDQIFIASNHSSSCRIHEKSFQYDGLISRTIGFQAYLNLLTLFIFDLRCIVPIHIFLPSVILLFHTNLICLSRAFRQVTITIVISTGDATPH